MSPNLARRELSIKQSLWMGSEYEKLFQTLAETSPDAVGVIGLEGRILFVNQRAVTLFGCQSATELVDQNILDFISPAEHDAAVVALREELESPLDKLRECRMKRKDGSIFPAQTSCSVVNNSSGEPMGFICIIRNIAENKIAEEELRSIAKRAMLYLDLMSHDIANQLQVIMGSSELLSSLVKGSEVENLANNITDSTAKCGRIIALTERIEDLESSPLFNRSLDQVLKNLVLSFVSSHDNLEIIDNIQVADAIVRADMHLEELLENIIENAYEHNQSSDKIIWVSLSVERNGYMIRIGDNGLGISDASKEHLFNTARRNAGVGLHFASQVILKYGGVIEACDRVHDSPEEGAEFCIWIPRSVI